VPAGDEIYMHSVTSLDFATLFDAHESEQLGHALHRNTAEFHATNFSGG